MFGTSSSIISKTFFDIYSIKIPASNNKSQLNFQLQVIATKRKEIYGFESYSLIGYIQNNKVSVGVP